MAAGLDSAFGPGVRSHPGYRVALIEAAVVKNAAVSAHTVQQAIGGIDGVRTAYGVYVLADRSVWAPPAEASRYWGSPFRRRRRRASSNLAMRFLGPNVLRGCWLPSELIMRTHRRLPYQQRSGKITRSISVKGGTAIH